MYESVLEPLINYIKIKESIKLDTYNHCTAGSTSIIFSNPMVPGTHWKLYLLTNAPKIRKPLFSKLPSINVCAKDIITEVYGKFLLFSYIGFGTNL